MLGKSNKHIPNGGLMVMNPMVESAKSHLKHIPAFQPPVLRQHLSKVEVQKISMVLGKALCSPKIWLFSKIVGEQLAILTVG